MKKILTILLISLASCTGQNHSFDWKKPVLLNMNPPQGPKNYQQGWVDGCKTALASTSNNFQMSLGSYKFTLDPHLRYERLYKLAWQYAFNHCGYSMKSMAQYRF